MKLDENRFQVRTKKIICSLISNKLNSHTYMKLVSDLSDSY